MVGTTKPLAGGPTRLTLSRVPGEEAVEVAKVVVGGEWREPVAQ